MDKISIGERRLINERLEVRFGKRSCSTCNRVFKVDTFRVMPDKRSPNGFNYSTLCPTCENLKSKSTNQAIKLIREYMVDPL